MSSQPDSVEQLQEIVRNADTGILPIGAGTKPALSAAPDGFEAVSTSRLTGILDYDPSEFTFTALAGTPLSEIEAALAENGQYLPFDPPFSAEGATLGGTVAAGLSGPGSFRFGGVRDFILWIEFLDGRGTILTGGGKVVKNAAGFDFPKFMTGSLGRFGVLTRLTFKVFPCPPASATLSWSCDAIDDAVTLLKSLALGPWDFDALEIDEDRVIARLRVQPDAVEPRIKRLLEAVDLPGEVMDQAEDYWKARNRFEWASPDAPLLKIPATPRKIVEIDRWCAEQGARRLYSIGGNVAYVCTSAKPPFAHLALRGPAPRLVTGGICDRLKTVFTPALT